MSTTPAVIATTTEAPPVSFVLPVAVEEPAPPRVEALISQVAKEFGISSTTLYNLAYSESRLDPDPPGHNDGGLAAGIVQIHYDTWHFTREQVLDPEFSLRFAAKHIKAGDAWKYWTPLNCYTYVDTKFSFGLPKMAQIVPNSEPYVGSVAIFHYSGGVKHIAYVTAIGTGSFTVKEANFKAGVIGTRTIQLSDPFLDGFWMP